MGTSLTAQPLPPSQLSSTSGSSDHNHGTGGVTDFSVSRRPDVTVVGEEATIVSPSWWLWWS